MMMVVASEVEMSVVLEAAVVFEVVMNEAPVFLSSKTCCLIPGSLGDFALFHDA